MSGAIEQYDISVYGATMPGVAAAVSAADLLGNDARLLVINPQPGWGGIGGVGGQNFWDRRVWHVDGGELVPQGGSFRRWYEATGQAYDPGAMERRLRSAVTERNASVYHGWDVVRADRDGDRLHGIELRPIDGGTERRRVRSDVFVDASESARLSVLAGVPHTVGRADWGPDDRQMAATLMVPVNNVDFSRVATGTVGDGESVFRTHTDPQTQKRLFWGGHEIVARSNAVEVFADAFPRFAIKAMNAAEDADGQFWLNTLLCYGVDGRFRGRPWENPPSDEESDHANEWDHATAYERARTVVADERFRHALAAFPGLEDASIVRDGGTVRTAGTLYLRETVHIRDPNRGFALVRADAERAGEGLETGHDARHYDRRVGLAYYWLDNNGYRKHPEKNPHGATELLDAANPMYVPYDALTTEACSNLLVPGYAARVGGEAWFALRVLPNLCVLGDAAGVAAAVSHSSGTQPEVFSDEQVSQVRHHLRESVGAVLDKRRLAAGTRDGTGTNR